MADITMCSGEGCPLKETCYRYTADSGVFQSWFLFVPYDVEEDVCDEYWTNV